MKTFEEWWPQDTGMTTIFGEALPTARHIAEAAWHAAQEALIDHQRIEACAEHALLVGVGDEPVAWMNKTSDWVTLVDPPQFSANLWWPLYRRPANPDQYCHTEADGSCTSTDPRCMHNAEAIAKIKGEVK